VNSERSTWTVVIIVIVIVVASMIAFIEINPILETRSRGV
jgi:hypothetical protein